MIALPSRSGRTRARSSCLGDAGDPLLQVVVRALRAAARARVAGGAIGPDELVQPGQQLAGVGDVPAHRGIGPLPLAVAVEPQVQEHQHGDVVDQRLGIFSARIRLRTSFAPTTSWWWKLTPPPGSNRRVAGLPMSCSSAAQPQHQVRGRLLGAIA